MKSLFKYRAAFPARPRRDRLAGFLRVLAAGALAISMHAGEWRMGVVEAAIGGRYSSLQVDKFGNAHVCSNSPANNTLAYAFWDRAANKWFTTVLDASSGFCSLVLDSQQRPHISYLGYGNGRLKYAYWTGDSWNKQVIEIKATRIISYNTSIALDAEDHPSISCYEEGIRLRVVRWNGKFWETRTADNDQGSGKFNSMGMASGGYPEVAYGNVEYKNASLRFARWNGSAWDVEILEGEGRPGTSMWSVALLVDQADVPHIAYTDIEHRLIKYAVKRGGKWDLQIVDSIAGFGYPDRNGIAVDEHGNVYISYFDAGSGLLKLAYKKDQKWVNEVVDSQSAGITSCLRIVGDTIWLTYGDETGEGLRYARGSLLPSSSEANPASPGGISK
jgi:hypothetical protein